MQHRFLLSMGLAAALAATVVAPASAAQSQWTSMGPNASGGYLAFTPAAPARLFVLPDGADRVFRSDDHGVTWAKPAQLGTPNMSGDHIAADPTDGDVVYVAASVLGGGEGHVFRSTDGARTFRPVLNDKADIADVATSGRKVYAAGTSGVFASDDRGAHWRLLPGSPAGAKRLVLDGSALFVATDNAIYRIDDGVSAKLPVPGDIFVEYLAAHGQLVVASQERDGSAVISTDGGHSWRPMTGPWGEDWVSFLAITPGGDIQTQTLQPSDGTSARKNTWVSHDNGRHWTAEPAALPALDLYSDLGSFPDRPRELVISAAAGIYTTSDSARFRRIGVPAAGVNAMAVSGSALVAGTSVDSYRSTSALGNRLPAGYQDWGWTGKAPATIGNGIGGLAALPGKDMVRVRNAFCPDPCISLERSHDGGATWQATAPMVPGGTRSVAADSSTIYVATYLTSASLYTSSDGGKTLTPRSYDGADGAWAVATDARGSVWIADHAGLFHSTDSGVTAVKVFAGNVEGVAVHGDTVVAVGDKIVKISRDGGKTFTDSGLTADYDAVAFGPDGSVYVGSHSGPNGPGQGLLRSRDGQHWTDLSAGLPDRDVRSLLTTADWLFVGTGSSGIYRLPLG